MPVFSAKKQEKMYRLPTIGYTINRTNKSTATSTENRQKILTYLFLIKEVQIP